MSAFLGPEVTERNTHLFGIRQLTRNLDKVFDDIHDEIVFRCKHYFTTKPKRAKRWWRKESKERVDLEADEWAEQNAQEIFFDLANSLNQRIFVGLPLGPCVFPHVSIAERLTSRLLVLSPRRSMDGQCPQYFHGPCNKRGNRVLYTDLFTIVRLLLVHFISHRAYPSYPVLLVVP